MTRPHTMTFLMRCAIVVSVAGSSTAAFCQVPDARVMNYLDSALQRIRMTRTDLTMHWDSYPDDSFRLSAIKHFFEDPLSTFGFSDTLARTLRTDVEAPVDFVGTVARAVDVTMPEGTALPRRLSSPELLVRYGVRLEQWSPPIRSALVELLSGIAAADTLVRQARSVYSPEELQFLVDNADSLLRESEEDKNASLVQLKQQEMRGDSIAQRFLALAERFPRELIFRAAAILWQSANVARSFLTRLSEVERDTVASIVMHGTAGDVAVGGIGADRHAGNFVCVLELGGDDTYIQPATDKFDALARPASAIIDLDGNDTYFGGDYSIASGYFGVGLLDDERGDDTYHAGSFSIGSGMFGAGILIDRLGNDHYSGGTFVEGAGAFGFGVLIDYQGNDSYEAALHAQGFGFTWGLGAIIENGGNDVYSAAGTFVDVLRYDDHFETLSQGCGLGIRPFAGGGIGLIADAKGNDTYLSDIYGQGVGYWYALGAVVDEEGNDRYMSYQYAQGAGIHLAFGVLLDKTGTDYYNAHGVSMGCGHDIGFGGLLDCAGDDFYATEGLSLGAGNANAVSFFCDEAGDDGYLAKASNTFGYSDNRRGYGMIGVFLDLGGKDVYPTSTERDAKSWTASTFGAGIDVNLVDTAQVARKARQAGDDSVRAARDLAKDIYTLYLQASAAPQKYQYLVEPARKALIDRKNESIPFLLTRLRFTSPRERLAMTEMFPKMGNALVRALVDSLHSTDERAVNMSLFVLGKTADSIDADSVVPLLASPSWRVRANAAEQLGMMKNHVADAALRQSALDDSIDMVRMRAVGALGALRDRDGVHILLAALSDRSQLVRNKAHEALDSMGMLAMDEVREVYRFSDGFAKLYLAELLVKHLEEKRIRRIVPVLVTDPSPYIRGLALTAMHGHVDERDLRLLKRRMHDDPDATLRTRAAALVATIRSHRR